MDLSIIIVNYKTPELTLQCIESIKNSAYQSVDYEIIVVDNHSEDNSQALLTNYFSDVVWINNPVNEGFGRANNKGINQTKGEYILLMNSDIIVLPNAIEKCMEHIKQENTIGALGCQLLNENGGVQKSWFNVAGYSEMLNRNLFIDKFFRLEDKGEKAIMGSFLLFPRNVLQKTGLFDPDFFMYCEELELGHRILKAGFKIEQNTDVSVIHKHGASSNPSWATRQKLLSTALLFYKVHGFWGYLLYHSISILNSITNFLLMWFIEKPYRIDYFSAQKAYFSNTFYYFSIPFLFNRNLGNGKRMLKRN